MRGFFPRLEHVVRDRNCIKEEDLYRKRVHRVVGTIEFRSGEVAKNCFVLFCAKDGSKKRLWVGTVLLFFGTELLDNTEKKNEEFSIVQYMECMEALDDIDEVLVFSVCMT